MQNLTTTTNELNTYIGQKGYTILKKELNDKQVSLIKKELMVRPYIPGSPVNNNVKTQNIVKSGLVDGLAHLDLIKIFGHRPSDQAEILPLINETLDLIKSADMTIEISTAGWRKPVQEIYPSEEIIKQIKQKNIPITIASDAHAPNHLAEDYTKLQTVLEKYEFTEIAIFEKHKRTLILL